MSVYRRAYVFVGAVVAGALPLAMLAAGCGGDDTGGKTSLLDGGADGTVDAAGDGDAAMPDSSPKVDGSPADASPDVAPDVVTDAHPVFDGPPFDGAIIEFPQQVKTAYCERIAACCQSIDAGALPGQIFDMPTCVADLIDFGYQGNTTGEAFLDSGHVALNATQAASCLAQIAAVDCTADLLSSSQEKSIIGACFGALTGTQDAGAACNVSLECAPGTFCEPLSDGGGTCTPLRPDGGSCADLGRVFDNAAQICSYRGSGNTGLTCLTFDPTTNVSFADAASFVCVPQLATGANCSFNDNCQSLLCNQGLDATTCENAQSFVGPLGCVGFFIDAGGD
jgi:hypothetical protein